jgi:hypothetical protein
MEGQMGLELASVSGGAVPLSYLHQVLDLPGSPREMSSTKDRKMIHV